MRRSNNSFILLSIQRVSKRQSVMGIAETVRFIWASFCFVLFSLQKRLCVRGVLKKVKRLRAVGHCVYWDDELVYLRHERDRAVRSFKASCVMALSTKGDCTWV